MCGFLGRGSEVAAVPAPVADGVVGDVDGFGREAEVLGQDAADKAGHPVVVGGGGRAVQADGHVGALFQLLAAQPELAVVLDRDHQISLGLVQGGDGLAEGGLEGFALFGGGGDGGAQINKRHGDSSFGRGQVWAVRVYLKTQKRPKKC